MPVKGLNEILNYVTAREKNKNKQKKPPSIHFEGMGICDTYMYRYCKRQTLLDYHPVRLKEQATSKSKDMVDISNKSEEANWIFPM